MDEMGYYHQFLPANIRGMSQKMVLAGRAMPVKIEMVKPGEKKPWAKKLYSRQSKEE